MNDSESDPLDTVIVDPLWSATSYPGASERRRKVGKGSGTLAWTDVGSIGEAGNHGAASPTEGALLNGATISR